MPHSQRKYDMSLEAFGDGGDDDDPITEERCAEIATEAFRLGAQASREMMARFVEQGGNSVIANSIRANWNPQWGADPGRIADAEFDAIRNGFDPWAWA